MKRVWAATLVAAAVLAAQYVTGEAKAHRNVATTSVPMQACAWLGFTIHGTTNFSTQSTWKTLYFENRGSGVVTVEAVTATQDETATLQPSGRAIFPNFVGGGNLAVTASASGVALYHCP